MNEIQLQLQTARDVLAGGHWCKGAYALAEGGYSVSPASPKAVKFCMLSALSQQSDNALHDCTPYLRAAVNRNDLMLIQWNDGEHRTLAQVLKAFDKAIELAGDRS